MSGMLPRRRVLRMGLHGVALLAAAAVSFGSQAAPRAAPALRRIGIIGAGHIGGTLASLWVKAGYQVMISSRHPEQLLPLAHSLGPAARVGTPVQAAAFGQVLVISIPYGALPQVGRELAGKIAGKIVLDTCNPVPRRDGPMAVAALREGAGVASARYLRGARVVRAFNTVPYRELRRHAHQPGEPLGIPIAGDNARAVAVAERLILAAGFEPVLVGPLSAARHFDPGTPVYGRALSPTQLRAQLGLKRSRLP